MNKAFKDMLIGVLLGDAHIGRTGLDKAYITFEQSKKKLEYISYLHSLTRESGSRKLEIDELKTYTRTDARYSDRINQSLYFRTNSLEDLKPFADMFLNNEGGKIIPTNIADHLTPRSLAFWIMDDGQQVKRGGVTLCTDSFNSSEVNILREALSDRFNISSSIHNKKGKNDSIYERIYINKESLDDLKPLLKEHMHDSMLYKINETPENVIEENTPTTNSEVDLSSDIGDF
jgi:LAGLIDADG DNA endonuclease family